MAPEIETVTVAPNGGIPNHPAWPALIYRGAFDPAGGAGPIRARFAANGWTGLWEWGVYDYHHFHPDAAEVLGVAKGTAELQLGGPDGPMCRVRPGDVLILPAGFGHRSVSCDDGFTVVGGYPEGQASPGIRRAGEGEVAAADIAKVPRPAVDPVFGADGPLPRLWTDQVGPP